MPLAIIALLGHIRLLVVLITLISTILAVALQATLVAGMLSPSVVTYIISPPLSYVRSGIAALDYGTLRSAGANGYDWSAMSHSTLANAYDLYLGSSGINPSDNSRRLNAFPVHDKSPRISPQALCF